MCLTILFYDFKSRRRSQKWIERATEAEYQSELGFKYLGRQAQLILVERHPEGGLSLMNAADKVVFYSDSLCPKKGNGRHA